MEIKIKRQELLTTLQRLKVVQGLNPNVLQEFSRLFKVKDDGNSRQAMIQAFKSRIADIFVQQGQAYEDYLQLPKFRGMSPERQAILNNVFKRVWDECQEIRHKEHLHMARQEIQNLKAVFKSTDQAEKFHLNLLHLYRQSALCPKSKLKNTKFEEMQPENSYNSSHFNQSQNNHNNNIKDNPNPYPFQTKMEAPQEGTQYIQPLFDVPQFPQLPPQHQSYMTPQCYINPPQNLPYESQHNPQYQNNQTLRNIYNEQSWPFAMHKFTAYEFIQCVCEGRYGKQNNQRFKCQSCYFSYHLNCLRIQKTGKDGIMCPMCNLRKESIFCKVMKEPLKSCWYVQDRNANEFRLQLNEEQAQQVIEAKKNGLDCQIRFLKIDGSNLGRGKYNSSGFVTQGGILHKQIKHSEITLPEFVNDPNHPTVEIVLKGQQENKTFSPQLYFFAVFLVRLRKVEQIVQQLIQSDNFFPPSFYDQFFTESQSIQIKLNKNIQDSQGLMKYPVRGINCTHYDVFDYQKYLNLVSSLKKDRESELKCPICSITCPSFKYDAFLYNQIKSYKQYLQQKPQGIQISKNGQTKWLSMERFIIVEEQNNVGMEVQAQKNEEIAEHHSSGFLDEEQDEINEEH